jgi:hypothetical protein
VSFVVGPWFSDLGNSGDFGNLLPPLPPLPQLGFQKGYILTSQGHSQKTCDFSPRSPSSVTLSGAPRKTLSRLHLEREVEGPRQRVLCHADSGSSTQNPSFWPLPGRGKNPKQHFRSAPKASAHRSRASGLIRPCVLRRVDRQNRTLHILCYQSIMP